MRAHADVLIRLAPQVVALTAVLAAVLTAVLAAMGR
jgi:hypothetical protein